MFSALTACAHEDMTTFHRHVSAIYINGLLSLGHSLIFSDVSFSCHCVILLRFYVRLSHTLLKYCVTVLIYQLGHII